MNDPFREYMMKHDISEQVRKILDDTEKRLLIKLLELAEVPADFRKLLIKLIENGCPVSAIVKTFSDLGKDEEE